MMCTVRWTHGRQGVSWEAGRKLEELEELQTRSFSPGCAAAVAADTLYSLLSWLIQQHNHRQSHGAIRRPQGLLRWCFCRHIVQSSRDRVYSDTHVQCYKWPQLLHNHVFFLFYLFIYLFYIVVVLPYIDMNQPWIYMCSPSRSPLPSDPSGSSQCTSPEPLSHASNLDWWSVSSLIVYLFQCYFLRTPHPRLLPQSLKLCSAHLCLFFCFASRVVVTIFLNSKKYGTLHEFACHPCPGAVLIFSVSFQF